MKDARAQGDAPNYDLLLNVSLAVSAELGRRSMRLGDLLRVGPGAIVELDRRVDAPIDLLVNGRPVARGEIVAVDERYGVRITEVIARRGERT
jgi:flagellar motor switch protein FliN/FliY